MSKKNYATYIAITVQAAQRIYNWVRVMSNALAIHEMAKHNNNWYSWVRWNSWAWNGFESRETIQREAKWISLVIFIFCSGLGRGINFNIRRGSSFLDRITTELRRASRAASLTTGVICQLYIQGKLKPRPRSSGFQVKTSCGSSCTFESRRLSMRTIQWHKRDN